MDLKIGKRYLIDEIYWQVSNKLAYNEKKTDLKSASLKIRYLENKGKNG